MARKTKPYFCSLVNETVNIKLIKKRTAGLRSERDFFVQCDQDECQYVSENKAPCPLRLSLFSSEIEEREEKARIRNEDAEYF